MSGDVIEELRGHLETAMGLAAKIDLELTAPMRNRLLDLIDELSFLEAITVLSRTTVLGSPKGDPRRVVAEWLAQRWGYAEVTAACWSDADELDRLTKGGQ